MFPKPSFNTEQTVRFTPSPTAAGGNRAQRRAKAKKNKPSKAAERNAEMMLESFPDSPTAQTDANVPDWAGIAETVYANHKHPKGRANNG